MNVAPPAPSRPRGRAVPFAAGALLALFWWQAVSATWHLSQTTDELPHLTGGYVYDRFGDFRMHPENGNLPQRLHGLAPLVLGAKFPRDEARWRESSFWQLGWDFLYGLGNPTDRMLLGARALNALFGVALGAFIFAAARRRHGDAGGLLALAFYALCPNFLAHAALATSDLAAALFLTLAPWLFWRHLRRRDLASGLLAALAGGLAQVAKFNGGLLAPMYLLLAAGDVWLRGEPGTRGRRAGRDLGLLALQTAGAGLVIWTFYDFRYSARAPGTPPIDKFTWAWPEMVAQIGPAGTTVLETLRTWRVLPEAFLYGLTNSVAGSVARPAFFAGEYGLHGWWQFFPTLFLVKTPEASLAALSLALGLGLRAWRQADAAARRAGAEFYLPLAVAAGVVWAVAVAGNLNIGLRHVLAVYPVLFVALGGLARGSRPVRIAAGVALAGQLAASAAIRPHYLSYFNTLGGGPERAYRLVVDSSIDWGQDLPALHDWLARNRRPGEPVYLSYFGSAWAPHYGVRPTRFLPSFSIVRPPPAWYEPEPGLYCLSVTMLAEVYELYRGPWTPERERRYRAYQAEHAAFARAVGNTIPPDLSQEQWAGLMRRYNDFDHLRLARLCKYLWRRPPDGRAGYSILIFRLGADELHAALEEPVKAR